MVIRNHFQKSIAAFIITTLVSFCTLIDAKAFASSFALQEQNVTNLGFAYAGKGSLAEDASTGYYNPAGLTELKNAQLQVSFIGILPNVKLTPISATNNGGFPLTTLNPVAPMGNALIPSVHFAAKINNSWAVSFNIVTPFGLRNDYPINSSARYMATKSEIKTIDFSPSIGYKVTDKFSIGAGIDALYTRAWLDSQVNFTPNTAPDGDQKNYAKNWSYGFHVGLLYKVSDKTKLGLSYRHKYNVKMKGTQLTEGVLPIALNGARTLNAQVVLPESILYSVYSRYNDVWEIMGDVEWTRWSRFRSLVLQATSANGTVTSTTPESYKNTFRFSLGTAYQYNDKTKLKFGLAYDQSPTKDQFRTARIPDSARYWVALGGQHKFNKFITLDVGYSHIFFKSANIMEAGPISSTTGRAGAQSISGKYKSKADIVGIQLIWNFV